MMIYKSLRGRFANRALAQEKPQAVQRFCVFENRLCVLADDHWYTLAEDGTLVILDEEIAYKLLTE